MAKENQARRRSQDKPIIENVRLHDLVHIVGKNEKFYLAFIDFLQAKGYESIAEFVSETSDEVAISTMREFLEGTQPALLLDGLGEEYEPAIANW